MILQTIVLCFGLLVHPPDNGWSVFSKVKFTPKFYKEHNEYFLTPSFDARIRDLETREITLRGHYLPMDTHDRNVIILSRQPYSTCFFCGGAGPETVAEIHFSGTRPRLKADQVITVKGILKLNDKDIAHMNFILREATLVE